MDKDAGTSWMIFVLVRHVSAVGRRRGSGIGMRLHEKWRRVGFVLLLNCNGEGQSE